MRITNITEVPDLTDNGFPDDDAMDKALTIDGGGGLTGPGSYIFKDCDSNVLTVRFLLLFGCAFFIQCIIIYLIVAYRLMNRRRANQFVVPEEVRHREVLAMVQINPPRPQ